MLSAVLAAVLHAQITVLSPTDLLPRLPHTTGYVVGTTAVFGAPYYGQKLRGRLTYGKSYGDHYCSPDDYQVTFPDADRSQGLLNIVVVKRGICTFVKKVRVAQDTKNADAVIIVDRDDSPYTPSTIRNIIVADDGTGGSIRIPSILISKEAGNELIAWLETDDREPILVEL